jgi:hypothetical protein
VSKHGALVLHLPEETVLANARAILTGVPGAKKVSPIAHYFSTANRLASKIAKSSYADDAEILGLLLLGVVSAAEFYFRTILGITVSLCPVCRENTEMLQVPIAAFGFYAGSGYSHAIGAYEHESFADAKKIRAECKRLTGFDISSDASATKAIEDFELLCELRHCLVHTSGYAGLKACRALGSSERSLQKLIVRKTEAFELMKLSHNAVRALNRFLADSIVDRWVDREILTGSWKDDRELFTNVIEAFWIKGEDSHRSIAYNAYRPFQRAIAARKRGMAARVAAAPPASAAAA